MRVRLWLLPDGTVRQSSVAPWLPPNGQAQEYARIALRWPPGTTALDLDESELPARAQRHRWRHQNGRVVIDPAIPDPPDRLADLRSSTTLAELKTALARLLG